MRNATQINLYRIVALDRSELSQDVGDPAILSATLGADGINVTLGTSPQLDIEYKVIVTNVAARTLIRSSTRQKTLPRSTVSYRSTRRRHA